MAENKARVFIVATANDITSLPPELVRKGRLDEIFFVDLPQSDVRAEIFSIHLRKRNLEPAQFDLPRLARCSEGFSGAEIEQAIVAARYSAHAKSEDVAIQHVVDEIEQTRPLSVVVAEDINNLRAWARDRTVSAD
jgi:SpoVK/Ycf46/Vps4 family AAA+-type ATPase